MGERRGNCIQLGLPARWPAGWGVEGVAPAAQVSQVLRIITIRETWSRAIRRTKEGCKPPVKKKKKGVKSGLFHRLLLHAVVEESAVCSREKKINPT